MKARKFFAVSVIFVAGILLISEASHAWVVAAAGAAARRIRW
jgi:hypothetical protein